MFYGFLRAFIATCFVMISLYLWRSAYAYCDWGALALLPLSVVLFVGHREAARDVARRYMGDALAKRQTKLDVLVSGRRDLNSAITGVAVYHDET